MSDLFSSDEQRERDARMAAAVTSYGVGTKSYNSSGEAREVKRQRAEATARYEASTKSEIALDGSWLMCRCDGNPDPHPAHAMREILNFRPWFRWAYLVARARGELYGSK